MVRTRQLGPQNTSQPEEQVDSLRRGLEVLRLFDMKHRSLSISKIASRLDLSRLTTEKLVATLQAHHFLRPVGDDAYEPHIACLTLGRAVKRNLAVGQAARPLMLELSQRHGVHIILCTRDRLHMLVVEHCMPVGKVQLGLTTGARFPLAASASGRAFLWAQRAEQRRQLLEQIENDTAPGAFRKLADVYAAFETLKEKGWCTVTAPVANQSASIATSVTADVSYTLAAMAVGPKSTDTQLLEQIAPELLTVAGRIIPEPSQDA